MLIKLRALFAQNGDSCLIPAQQGHGCRSIQFKEVWNATASLKTICAFANALENWEDRYIVIRVEEDEGRPAYPLKGVSVDKYDAYQKSSLRL